MESISRSLAVEKRSCSSNLKPLDPLRKIQFSPQSYFVELQGDIKLTERALTPVTFWHFTQEKMNLMFFSAAISGNRLNSIHPQYDIT